MAHAHKSDFFFRRNGRVHLNQWGRHFSRILAIELCADYTVFRGSVKGTGYLLHSPVSPSLPHPCVTVCYYISTGVYHHFIIRASRINNRKNATAIIITIAIKTSLRILPVYTPTVCNAIISEILSVEAPFDLRVNLQYLLATG